MLELLMLTYMSCLLRKSSLSFVFPGYIIPTFDESLFSRRQTSNFKQNLEYGVDQGAAMQRFQAGSGNNATSISSSNIQTMQTS